MDFSFWIELDADLADIFELRGTIRERRGRRLETKIAQGEVVLAYEGLDGRPRRARIVFDPPPTRLSESAANYQIQLEPGEDASYRWAIACEVHADARGQTKPCYDTVVQEAAAALESAHSRQP